MRISTKKKDNIEYMLWLGMTVGEIQAVYPEIKDNMIKAIGKETGVETRLRKSKQKLKTRDTQAIARFLKRLIAEDSTLKNIRKIEVLIQKMDDSSLVSDGQKFRERIKIHANRRNQLETISNENAIEQVKEVAER